MLDDSSSQRNFNVGEVTHNLLLPELITLNKYVTNQPMSKLMTYLPENQAVRNLCKSFRTTNIERYSWPSGHRNIENNQRTTAVPRHLGASLRTSGQLCKNVHMFIQYAVRPAMSTVSKRMLMSINDASRCMQGPSRRPSFIFESTRQKAPTSPLNFRKFQVASKYLACYLLACLLWDENYVKFETWIWKVPQLF